LSAGTALTASTVIEGSTTCSAAAAGAVDDGVGRASWLEMIAGSKGAPRMVGVFVIGRCAGGT